VSSGQTTRGRRLTAKTLEDKGATVLFVPPFLQEEASQSFPNTAALDGSEIRKMPDFVRSFRCGDQIEKGDPTCGDEKFTKLGVCDDRKGRTHWHPGWKWHAMMGNLQLLGMMEYIDQALKLIAKPGVDQAVLLKQLKEREEESYQSLISDESFHPILYKAPAVCHTARLPAETRFQGILTESDKKGFFNYDRGVPFQRALRSTGGNGEMALVSFPEERENCSIPLDADYKDAFVAHSNFEGFSSLTIPNDAERKAYLKPGHALNGTIVFCFKVCDWGKCPPKNVEGDALQAKKATIRVNGIPATALTPYYKDCVFLEGPTGLHGWKANSKGQYEIGVKIHDDDSFMRLSSVVVM